MGLSARGPGYVIHPAQDETAYLSSDMAKNQAKGVCRACASYPLYPKAVSPPQVLLSLVYHLYLFSYIYDYKILTDKQRCASFLYLRTRHLIALEREKFPVNKVAIENKEKKLLLKIYQ
jgi:hypothetical protein